MCTVRAPELATDALVSAKKCAPELSADAIAGHTVRAAIASRPATGESRSDFSIMNLPSMTFSDVAWHSSAVIALSCSGRLSVSRRTCFAGSSTSSTLDMRAESYALAHARVGELRGARVASAARVVKGLGLCHLGRERAVACLERALD